MFFVSPSHFPIRGLGPKTRLLLIMGVLGPSLLWGSLGLSATYRCHDQSGNTVLTDNPTQLFNCTLLESQIFQVPNIVPPTSKPINTTPMDIPQLSQSETPPSLTSPVQESSNDPQLTTDITVPLKKIGGSFVVEVTLNQERTAQLIVDTGASITVLSIDTALDLGILGTTDNELLTVNTAGGSVQVNMNYLSSLMVGKAQATNVTVVIHDLPDIPDQIEGLLGMSFLKHFLVTLDPDQALLILRPKPRS